mgnify:CR=1 FL=1
MKNFIISSLLLMTGASGISQSLDNKLPEGASLAGRISFDYDEEQCGPMEFRLDNNDDCTVEFLDFFAASDFSPVRECNLTITVTYLLVFAWVLRSFQSKVSTS